jgi:hypothetical protein
VQGIIDRHFALHTVFPVTNKLEHVRSHGKVALLEEVIESDAPTILLA